MLDLRLGSLALLPVCPLLPECGHSMTSHLKSYCQGALIPSQIIKVNSCFLKLFLSGTFVTAAEKELIQWWAACLAYLK